MAQTPEDSVRSSINRLFEAMYQADSAKLMTCFNPDAVLQTIGVDKFGKQVVRTESIAAFASFVQQQEKFVLDEKIEFASIHIDGALASVWTPYRFYFSNKFLHCGVNSFQLVRLGGEWKIQYLIDTRRSQGCDAVSE